MAKAFRYEFEWDPAKGRANERKHRITFERAATVFLDADALSIPDEEHSEEEERWITIGLDQTGNLLVVCHTYREETDDKALIRLISARKVTKNETRDYKRR